MPITIYEKDIEDWAEFELQEVTGEESAFSIGRQVALPSGRRLDILAGAWFGDEPQLRLYVIEVKSHPATMSALAQLVRYVDEVRTYWGGTPVRGILLATDLPADLWNMVDEMPDYTMAKFSPAVGFCGAQQWDFSPKEGSLDPEPDFVSQFLDVLKANMPTKAES